MTKKILSLILALSMILTISFSLSATAAEGDKRLFLMSAYTQNEYIISGYAGLINFENGLITLTHGEPGYIDFVFPEPITITKKNLRIRCRAMVEFDKNVGTPNYMMLRFYGPAGQPTAGENYIQSGPESGKWYEVEHRLDLMNLSTGQREYDYGDKFTSIRFQVQNKNNVPFKAYLEYIEVIEPEVDDSWPSYVEPENQGHDVIADVNKKIEAAMPGDTIVIPDGTYANVTITVPAAVEGTADKPITIKAENPGKVKIIGTSRLDINGKYVVVDGVYFTEGMNRKGAIAFGATSKYSRLTNSAIINYNGTRNPKTEHPWVNVNGQYNTVDHCYFGDKTGWGVMFTVNRSNGAEIDGHTIEYNYFGKYPNSGRNGTETIRYGLSSTWQSGLGSSTFRYNFFEECDGEDEVISVKSEGSEYAYNTFYATRGCLTLRHGGKNTVHGNLFIGKDEGKGSNTYMGLRIIGPDQKAYDNYFLHVADRSYATTIECGVISNAGDNYQPVENLEFHNNTYVGCDESIDLGTGYGGSSLQGKRVEVPQGKFYDNIIYSTINGRPLAVQRTPDHKLEMSNNIFYGERDQLVNPDEPGLIRENPSFLEKDGFLYLADGKGANVDEVNKAPKNPMEIAPDWIKAMYESGELVFNPVSHDVFNKDSVSAFDAANDILVLGLDKPFAYVKGSKTQVDPNNADIAPMVIDGRTMVPLRFISEACGANVEWDQETQGITITKKYGIWDYNAKNVILLGRTVKLNINQTLLTNKAEDLYSPYTVYQDDKVTLDVPATAIGGRTFIPLRACAEALGLNVHWDSRGVIIMVPAKSIADEFAAGSPELDRYAKMMEKI